MADLHATNGTAATHAKRDASDGRVVAVRGAVVDVAFDGGVLPAL